jgi:hypothetical protein
LNCKNRNGVTNLFILITKKLRKRRRRRKSKRNGQDAGETNGQRILEALLASKLWDLFSLGCGTVI